MVEAEVKVDLHYNKELSVVNKANPMFSWHDGIFNLGGGVGGGDGDALWNIASISAAHVT